MALKYASIPETITIMECCVCFENVKPEEAYKFWECDNHYTCRQCGTSLKTCPLCRAPADSAVRRRDRHRSAVRRRAHGVLAQLGRLGRGGELLRVLLDHADRSVEGVAHVPVAAHSLVRAKNKIREDWKEEAIRKGLIQTHISNVDDNNSVIIQSWTSEGRCLTSKREAAKLNIEDVRLSW